MFLFFEQQKKSSLQLYLPTASLGQPVQEKHPSLAWACKHAPPPTSPEKDVALQVAGVVACGTRDGHGSIWSRAGRGPSHP